MILTPVKNTEDRFNEYKKHYGHVRKNLQNEDCQDMDDFYNKNNISNDQEYVNIIGAGIVRPRIFLKRHPSEK